MSISNIVIWGFLIACILGGIAFAFVLFLDVRERQKMLAGLWEDVKEDRQNVARMSFLLQHQQQEKKEHYS